MTSEFDEQKRITLGRISGLYGVSGWLKIYSYSRPKENIFSYYSWHLQNAANTWVSQSVSKWKVQGKGLIAKFDGLAEQTKSKEFKSELIMRESLKTL